jgi:Immunoglobulin I-set domain/Immunoglobulin domain
MKTKLLAGLVLLSAILGTVQKAAAQPLDLHSLSSNVYTQTFDGLTFTNNPLTPGSLPPEWNCYTNVTPSTLGSIVSFDPNNTDIWTNAFSTNGFINYAGFFDYIGGTNFIGNETGQYQTNEPNRALGIRQTGGFGDPGASFVLKIADTVNLHNFALSLDMLNLDASSTRGTLWTVEYGWADPVYGVPAFFTPAATYSNTPGTFHMYHTNITLADGTINNTDGQVWLRVSALSPSAGINNRESFAIDNVGLTWQPGNGGCTAVTIAGNPTATTVYSNATAALTCSVNGTPPYYFQWLKDGQAMSDGGNIFGSRARILNIANCTAADQANYSCIVSNSCNGTLNVQTSTSALLTVTNPPAANIGFLHTLVDTNTFYPTNQSAMWQVTGIITSATNTTTGNTASYYLQDGTGGINLFITGGSSFRPQLGDEVSAVGFLSPFNGSLMEFFVDLTGAVGARNATYAQILSNNIAAYPQPKVISWDTLGVAPTNANLNYNYAGSIVILTNVYFGTNTGVVTPPPGTRGNKFYWVTNSAGKYTQIAVYDNLDNDLTNRTLPSFAYSVQGFLIPFTSTVAGARPTNGNYEIGITRWAEVNTTTPAAPLISPGPTNQTNAPGTTAAFSGTVQGYTPLGYQWLFNGNPLSDSAHISGSTTTSLNISNVTTADAGTYTLQATNWIGIATALATLTVPSPVTAVTNVVSVRSGSNLQITYSGGAANNFVLVGTNNVTAPVTNWPVVAITNGTTPATFTIPIGPGQQFFRIKSQ